jgi:hypothetical protein
MFRRILSIIFTLLATLILMAHTAIPHHHHIDQVCLIAAHCQNESDSHQHESETPLHEHDGTNDSGNCVLKQLVGIPTYHERPGSKNWSLDSYNSDFNWVIACLADYGSSSLNASIISSSFLPFSSSTYSNLISCCIGLRAPPIV